MPYLHRPDTTHIKPNENHFTKSPLINAVRGSKAAIQHFLCFTLCHRLSHDGLCSNVLFRCLLIFNCCYKGNNPYTLFR